MKKRIQRKLELSRETLRSLGEAGLREAAGGSAASCPQLCGSDAPTCVATCFCTGLGCA